MSASMDLARVPVSALRKATLSVLSAGLNRHKIIPNDEGIPRDWRGLAHLIGLTGVGTARIAASNDPIAELIKQWGQQGTIEKLQQFLGVIDRFDILDDSHLLMEKDAEVFYERASTPQRSDVANSDSDSTILTVDDVVRLEQGLEPQTYDAYLLFAEEDIDFAAKIVDTMEREYNLKFCIRDRDLVGGIAFEHEAIMKLIAERCRRLLVVLTPSFLRSPANKFFVTFAQALGIDQRKRKVIPILHEKFDLPPELSYYFHLDYSRSGVLWNFWDKLRDSILTPDSVPPALQSSCAAKFVAEVLTTATQQPIHPERTEEGKESSSPAPSKKPMFKALFSSVSNAVTTNKDKADSISGNKVKIDARKVDSGYQSSSGSKTVKNRLFKSKKKAEALLS